MTVPKTAPGVSRRAFIAGMGAAGAFACTPGPVRAAFEPLYPPIDLRYFEDPIGPAASDLRFGYAAITWNGDDRKAVEDVAALGFAGIQLRSNAVTEFDSKPAAVRDLLAAHRLTFVALSSGGVSIERPAAAELATHTAHAQFVRDAGGLYLQATDDRPNRDLTRDDYKELGHRLSELGKRTADLGIPLGYHNHMGSMGERPEQVDWILDAADPRYVKFELDIAHYLQGGGDPARAIERYHDRLLFLHIKDVATIPNPAPGQQPYRFVELGRGRVDLPGVFAAIQKVNFRGWAVIELDAVPDPPMSPKDCAALSKRYLADKLGYNL
jgi:inosose dehydratase